MWRNNFCGRRRLWLWSAVLCVVSTASAQTAVDSVRAVRSPKGAMFRSLVIPGWGQWYNGALWKAGLTAGTEVTLLTMAVVEQHRFHETDNPIHQDRANGYQWFLGLALLLAVTDAYVDAYLDRFDENLDIHAWQGPFPDAGEAFHGFRLTIGL